MSSLYFNSTMKKLIINSLQDILSEHIEEIKQLIIQQYDINLVYVVDGTQTLANPIYYKDPFVNRLNDFEYIKIEEDSIKFIVPDLDTFDFSNGLELLELIMSGLGGSYVELSQEDYYAMMNEYSSLLNTLPSDHNILSLHEEGIHLLENSSIVRGLEKALGKELNSFPFSNLGQIDIFKEANDFAIKSQNEWAELAINNISDDLAKVYVRELLNNDL